MSTVGMALTIRSTSYSTSLVATLVRRCVVFLTAVFEMTASRDDCGKRNGDRQEVIEGERFAERSVRVGASVRYGRRRRRQCHR